jgi:hypothetical protein
MIGIDGHAACRTANAVGVYSPSGVQIPEPPRGSSGLPDQVFRVGRCFVFCRRRSWAVSANPAANGPCLPGRAGNRAPGSSGRVARECRAWLTGQGAGPQGGPPDGRGCHAAPWRSAWSEGVALTAAIRAA